MTEMDRAYIVAHQVVERYLTGRLPQAEAEQFEEYLLGHPEFEDELRLTEQMKLGLRTLRERGELEALMRPGRRAWRGPAWAIAALILVTIGAGLYYAGRTGAPSGAIVGTSLADLGLPDEMQTRPVVTFRLMAARSAAPQILLLPAEPAAIELQVLPGQLVAGAAYRVRLARNESTSAAVEEHAVDGLKLHDDGNLHLYLRGDRLRPGEYRVAVTVAAPGQPGLRAGEFLIEFR